MWRLYDVRVVAGRETVLDYEYPRYGRLTGRVTGPDDKPVDGAEVSLATTGAALAYTDDEGKFAVDGGEFKYATVPVGRYRLRVKAKGFAPVLTGPVDLERETDIRISLSILRK